MGAGGFGCPPSWSAILSEVVKCRYAKAPASAQTLRGNDTERGSLPVQSKATTPPHPRGRSSTLHTCEHCQIAFYPWPRCPGRFCSNACTGNFKAALPRPTYTSKSCNKCGVSKPLEKFPNGATTRDGRGATCYTCRNLVSKASHAAYIQRRRIKNPSYQRDRYAADPERGRRSRKNWGARNPERVQFMQKAHEAVRTAIKWGRLIRPDTCARCGAVGVRIEAAHHDYNKPLEVEWLCCTCHRRWDKDDPKSLIK